MKDEPILEYIGQGEEHSQLGIRRDLVCVLYDGHDERLATIRVNPAKTA